MSRRIRTLASLSVVPLAVVMLSMSWQPVVAQEDEGPTLSVPEYGVGTDVVDHELQGKSDRFEEGAKVVFWTRVVGGEEGDRIRHVWIHDGEEVLSIGLALGGPHWRTYSRKTLHAGSAGPWRVEARDADGHVLAAVDFTCVGHDAGGADPEDETDRSGS